MSYLVRTTPIMILIMILIMLPQSIKNYGKEFINVKVWGQLVSNKEMWYKQSYRNKTDTNTAKFVMKSF